MSKNSIKEMKTEKKTEEHKEVIDQTESNIKSNKKSSTRSSSRSRVKDKELAKVKTELAEIKDKYLRLYSEFDNFRRRTAKEKLDLVSTANEDLMIEFLPVIDDFERAIKSFDADNGDVENIKEGVMLIFNKLNNVTEKKGLKGMETNPGDDFNSELHDAISHIPTPEKKLKGKIIDTIEKGYYLNDKVIRFAKVVTGA
jgi:molecular chaperone GrpE